MSEELKKAVACDPSRHLQESPGPLGPKSQKSLKKGLLGGLEKSLKKYLKKSPNTEKNCYTGVDQITTKGAGGSTHCQDNMLPRRECFLRIERALHRFCHKPSEGLARSVVLSHHSRV